MYESQKLAVSIYIYITLVYFDVRKYNEVDKVLCVYLMKVLLYELCINVCEFPLFTKKEL